MRLYLKYIGNFFLSVGDFFLSFYVFLQRSNNLVVELQSQNRGHRKTRLFPYNIFRLLLHILYLWFLYVAAYLSVSSHSLYVSPPTAIDTALYPNRSSPSYSHHLSVTHAPDIRTVTLQCPYLAVLQCIARPYSDFSRHMLFFPWTPPPPFPSPMTGPPNLHLHAALVVFLWSDLRSSDEKNRALIMRGVIIHVSNPNNSTAVPLT